MISRPRLSAITHVACCSKWEIHIATTRACPVILSSATFRRHSVKKMNQLKINIAKNSVYLAFRIAVKKDSITLLYRSQPLFSSSLVMTCLLFEKMFGKYEIGVQFLLGEYYNGSDNWWNINTSLSGNKLLYLTIESPFII